MDGCGYPVRRPTWRLLPGCHSGLAGLLIGPCLYHGSYALRAGSKLTAYQVGFLCQKYSGRVGAINLEQLDVLLDSLKTYWDYTNQKSFLDEIKHPIVSTVSVENMLIYEL